MMSMEMVRELFVRQYLDGSAHAGTIELLGVGFFADEPALFGHPNENYIQRELDWYLTEVPNINAMEPPVPAIWQQVANDAGVVNSQYGYLIFSAENGEQYNHVLAELRSNPDSRRGTMVYNRPSIHEDATYDGVNDFICTNAVTYELRGGLLYGIVQMRSNDAVFGYRNDWAWQKYVLERLADDLGVVSAGLVWQVASMHIYERHYPLIGEYIKSMGERS